MSEAAPPPIYSQEDPDESTDLPSTATRDSPGPPELQILIIPTVDAINFQKGFLGVDGERAAIEGELQLKGAEPGRWAKVTMSLRTVETAYEREIELGLSEVVLFSRALSPRTTLPSSMLFAIPLTQDTPQSVQTPHSSLVHTLTATLHPTDRLLPLTSKTHVVHTRRYTSHSYTLATSPETYSNDDPTQVKVEVPRTTFSAGETIPIYVTVPPPRKALVDQGLRLRNIKAELVQVVKVRRDDGGEEEISDFEPETPIESDGENSLAEGSSRMRVPPEKHAAQSSSKAPASPLFLGSSFRAILSRSGAQCRFHSSRPIQLRFILRQPTPLGSPSNFQVNLPSPESGGLISDAECASITQLTVLHSVTFRINVHVSFVDISSHSERICTITIPVTILPPPAPLPELAASMDVAYQKKHDQPPAKTNRFEDVDHSVPHYSEGQAGPSGLPSGAPPPFEERDAPPPFFTSAAEASTSTRLPTFLEAESEIIMPSDTADSMTQPARPSPAVVGEGFEFGFWPSEQFDGHSEQLERSSTPPPTLEMATLDTNVTQLAQMSEPERTIEALGLVLDQQEEASRGEALPPPPPAMDDPSDPPPSIDSDFRSPELPRQTSPPHPASPPLHPVYNTAEPPRLHTPSPAPPSQHQTQTAEGHAPPPYLVPDSHGEQESVTRPPPYVD